MLKWWIINVQMDDCVTLTAYTPLRKHKANNLFICFIYPFKRKQQQLQKCIMATWRTGTRNDKKKNIQMKQKPNRDNRKIRRRRRRKELLRGAMDNFLFPRMHLDFQSGGKKYPFVSCRLLHQCFLRFIESVAKFLYSLSDFFKKIHQVF